MPTPPAALREDPVSLISSDVRDTEVDLENNRLCWTGGGARNPLTVGRVDPGAEVVDQREIENDIGSDTAINFPNGAEWGRLASGRIGIYFSRRYDPDPDPGLMTAARVYAIDPESPGPDGTPEEVPVIDQSPTYDCWLNDAWEGLRPGAPLISFARAPLGEDPLLNGELFVHDSTGAWLPTTNQTIPNYAVYLDNTTNRAIRVVPEFPSMVFTHYRRDGRLYDPADGLPPDKWQFIWQHLNESLPGQFAGQQSYFRLGVVRDAAVHKVVGVGVVKLPTPNPHGHGFTGHGYCLYVLRREVTPSSDGSGVAQREFIDFHIFDYDDQNPARSREILSHSEPVPPISVGVDPDSGAPLVFRGIGDDESYVDPDGNPCIALAMVREIDNNPSVQAGTLVAVTLDYMGYSGSRPSDVSPTVTFDNLSPPRRVARKDPEVVPVTDADGRTQVYIFNRERPAGNSTAPWSLTRTLVWD